MTNLGEKSRGKIEETKEKISIMPKTELEVAWDEIASLKDNLGKATQEIEDWKEKYFYLQAEFDNAEKRRARSDENKWKRIKADIILAFLPLVDLFLPAVKKVEEGAYKDVRQLGEGLKSLKQQLNSILKGLNVISIDQTYVPLDYNLHEVTLSQAAPGLPEDTVIDIVQVGWKLGSDVIQPAKVIVSKKLSPPPLPESGW
ncbi:MAG: GrpE protein HSP-70 cofactor [Promethearchaeota archaeon CR_4]|nr:MAG: GrpE protein HSP-70 cofactor [Candidatus Lokiarchaeota archaeon CR_4]